MKIAVDIKACYGCRTCELACSFHRWGVFSPELSSIRVIKCNRTGQIDWSIGAACDLCKGEDSPLCVKYCTYGALKEIR
jgi:carbon-monoxide dehydrogenase iron sulfur subunit